MFKKIKKQARKTLISNYKFLVIPCSIFVFSNFVISVILNYFTSAFIWSELTNFIKIIMTILFVLLEFIMIPISLALIFKSIIDITEERKDGKNLKVFLSFSNVKKIVIINFLPRLLSGFSVVNKSQTSVFNFYKIDGIALIIISAASLFVSYKFYACNYCFTLNESSVKQTLCSSFKIMKKNFVRWILLALSFWSWILLIALISVLLKLIYLDGDLSHISNVYTPFVDSVASVGFGIDFYLIPYMYLVIHSFLKEQSLRAAAN